MPKPTTSETPREPVRPVGYGRKANRGIWHRLREVLRKLVLRGVLLDWWVARRARQWERAYRAQMIHSASLQLKAPSPSFSIRDRLRRILFIADCMWEQNDLVPELEKIAAVTVLNLRPELSRKRSGQQDSEVVVAAVRDFVSEHQSLEPDLIFLYARPALLSEEVFDYLRHRWSCPLMGMNLDDKFEFFPYEVFSGGVDNYQHWVKRFDVNLTNSLAATEWYQQLGQPCIYTPQGVHRPGGLSMPNSLEYRHEFGFLGSRKPERVQVIDTLVQSGIPIHVCGSGWPGSGWVQDPNRHFRETQINLGIGFASPSLTLLTLKGRDFECPGVGACYLTTYNWELTQHYELGKEILCYREVEELIEMYGYYHKRPELCLRIAQAAWERCSRDHTWEIRFRRVFQEIGFRLE